MEDGMTTTSTLSRRTLVASAAALPALAVPVAATTTTGTDPVFPAIAQWKKALAFSNGEFDNEIAEQAALDKEYEAMQVVFKTVPTTLQGIRAKIDFVVNSDFETKHVGSHVRHACTDEPLNAFLETLYDGARLIAGEA
jgi:hypothetical protein